VEAGNAVSSVKTVLVLGATGTLGPHVVEALRAKSGTCRAFTRDAARARARWGDEVEVAEGDFRDDAAIRKALDDVGAVLLLTPHARDMAETQIRIVRLARRSGARIVKISGTTSAVRPDGPDAGRQHWEVERILEASGQPFVILRPNAFMQSLLGTMVANSVRESGSFPNAVGQAGISFVDCADVGRVAAEALVDEAHLGKTYVLTGPAPVTLPGVAASIATHTDLDVAVVPVTPADLAQTLLRRGVNEWEASHFEEMYRLFRDRRSEYVSEDVLFVTGVRARSVEEYVAEHAHLFEGAKEPA
jgi:uncharacterized protein YbjT (DUF2867 family)